MKHTKKILILLGILVLGAVIVFLSPKKKEIPKTLEIPKEITQTQQNDTLISWEEFQEKAREDNAVVVDVRKPEEIAKGKLFEDALELNYFADDYREKVAQLEKDKTYLLYCQLGGRTVRSLDVFHENGLTAYCLDGGVDATQTREDNEREKHLSWEAFKEKAQEEDVVVIDIRTPDEYEQGKLFADALTGIDYYDSTFEQKIAQLDPSKTYLIYCRSGNRTGKSIPLFEKYGLKVYDLDGGIKATPEGSLQ